MNKVILVGNLTKDIELKKTQSNKSVCQFTLAINEGENKVEFINCRAWERNADNLERYTQKGNKLLVEGKIKVESYETQNGTRSKTIIDVYNIEFLTPKSSQSTQNVSMTPEESTNNGVGTHIDDDIYTHNVNIETDDLPFY